MNKLSKYIVAFIVVLLAIAIYLLFPDFNKSNAYIKIGVITPLTGDAAIYGEAAKNGIDLAAKKVNDNGGVLGKKIELIYEDTHLDSKTAVAAINKLINIDKVSFVIVAEGSGATLAVTPFADKNKMIMVVPIASVSSIKDAGDFVFRVMPSDGYRGIEMTRLAEEKGYNKIAILYVNDPYGVGIRDSLKKNINRAGKIIVSEESFESSATDFRTQLTKIKAGKPDSIMVAARAEFPIILRESYELGIKAQVIASEMLDKSLLNQAGKSAEGLLAIDFASNTDYVNFKSDYKEKYNSDPTLYSDYSYDSLMVLVEAIKKVGLGNTKKIKDSLYNLIYNGATGIIKFDSDGDVNGKDFVIYQVKNEEFVEVK